MFNAQLNSTVISRRNNCRRKSKRNTMKKRSLRHDCHCELLTFLTVIGLLRSWLSKTQFHGHSWPTDASQEAYFKCRFSQRIVWIDTYLWAHCLIGWYDPICIQWASYNYILSTWLNSSPDLTLFLPLGNHMTTPESWSQNSSFSAVKGSGLAWLSELIHVSTSCLVHYTLLLKSFLNFSAFRKSPDVPGKLITK